MRFKSSPKQFNGLTDDIAAANITVGKTVDSMMTIVSSKSEASKRTDWHEIQKTFRTVVLNSLVFGNSSLDNSWNHQATNSHDLKTSVTRQSDHESSKND